MNAVRTFAAALPRHALRRLLPEAPADATRLSTDELRRAVVDAFALDLVGFLNAARRHELEQIARSCPVPTRGALVALRERLWLWAAEREAGTRRYIGTALQPAPVSLAGALVVLGPVRGLAPPATALPRPVPRPRPSPEHPDEPETLAALLAAADTLIGVRLGPPRRNKGAFGTRIAALLGLVERGQCAPDWRCEVEVKTVPVVRDRGGMWRVAEDPCIGMARADALAKLDQVLWIARVADTDDSTVLSWYYQERDAEVDALAARHLHLRPKGGRGARTRGFYLHKRFFVESGFSRSLNG